jgi:hypothetical protein
MSRYSGRIMVLHRKVDAPPILQQLYCGNEIVGSGLPPASNGYRNANDTQQAAR